MCLMLTTLAGVISALLWYFKDEKNIYRLGTLALMYFGASLMWFVDSCFALSKGEAFLDLTVDDVLLGFVIITCGLLIYFIIVVFKGPKRIFQSPQ
ncbi:hypothetical protein OQH60_05495 [Campylobacter sp. MIT 21-1685]|uniref:hypothetical protein n=1 Tax=unclassified Campylobacter TaxID=2593542 RepID=UPI00224AB854|nr:MULTISPECIES: hypothetical protein [unclassified Campylobacter]MCX2683344.1 hypothetical protein [Campylobacter sp. MIT 21-1684]MCX2751601.1 hypothetical protein [Campylobacter sp. MIT 21-1682]MCX2807800.1 hypothetical protein [Campylobacter sp. MIT 21-1685]